MDQQNQEKKSDGIESSRIQLSEDGIVMIKTDKEMDTEILKVIVSEFKKIAKDLPAKPKILIDISSSLPTPSYLFRKTTVDVLADVYKDPGFGKMALWGKGAVVKVVALFILAATGLKNVQHFGTEKEALDWLNN